MAKTEAGLDTTFPGSDAGMVPNAPGESYTASGDIDALDVDFEGALEESAEYFDQWPLVEKIDLVGQPFVILRVDAFEGMSDDGIAYNIKATLKPDSSLIARIGSDHFSFNDGSTGVIASSCVASAFRRDTLRTNSGQRWPATSLYLVRKEQGIVDGPGPQTVQQSTFYLCSSPETALKSLTK